MVRAFTYQPEIQEIPRIREDLDFLGKEWNIPKSEIRQILLIIEELFSNIVRYAFEDNLKHPIDIRLGRADSQVKIEIIDAGRPFNPLEYAKGPQTDPASTDAGGMGLTLIRAFSSAVSYQRSSEKNHLTIIKTVKAK
jgi:anti-sigma regulatory factor (Ser/Thr protein kinase)